MQTSTSEIQVVLVEKVADVSNLLVRAALSAEMKW